MSGGVDSAVAAWLLKRQGYEVTGVYVKMWERSGSGCLNEGSEEDAGRVADCLGIRLAVKEAYRDFSGQVMDYFADSYLKGETPNPCIFCNPQIKWKALLQTADEEGAQWVATGHYARIKRLPTGRFTIAAGLSGKDQAYVLYRLSQEQLARTRMPLGEMEKTQVRKIAAEAGIPVADKKDSMEVCFIPDNDYVKFVQSRSKRFMPPVGNFVDAAGNILGQHQGIIRYTVGQRKGLGLAVGHPVFVTRIHADTNEVVIGEAKDLMTSSLYCRDVCWMGMEEPGEKSGLTRAFIRIRYAHRGTWGYVMPDEGRWKAVFDEPVRAAAPGQSAVWYDEEGCILGGGIITQA